MLCPTKTTFEKISRHRNKAITQKSWKVKRFYDLCKEAFILTRLRKLAFYKMAKISSLFLVQDEIFERSFLLTVTCFFPSKWKIKIKMNCRFLSLNWSFPGFQNGFHSWKIGDFFLMYSISFKYSCRMSDNTDKITA